MNTSMLTQLILELSWIKRIINSFLILLLVSISYSQVGTKTTVIVYDNDHKPLQNVSVQILGLKKLITNSEGKVVFSNDEYDIGTEQYFYITHKDYYPIKDTFLLMRNSKDNFLEFQFTSVSNERVPIIRYLKGRIIDVDSLPIENALVSIDVLNSSPKNFTTQNNGIFFFELEDIFNDSFAIKALISKNDYLSIDTIITIRNSLEIPLYYFKLYKDSFSREFHGKVNRGNRPLEDVVVKASGSVKESYLSVFTAKKNNITGIPAGSFILHTDEKYSRKDSIILTLSKENYTTVRYTIDLEDINSSEAHVFYLNNTISIPKFGYNSISLKLSIPYTSIYEWYVSLEYFKRIKFLNAWRLDLGINLGYLSCAYNDKVYTFLPNESFDKESVYSEYLIGLSSRYWIVNPDYRYFASYLGVSFEYALVNRNFNIYPFLGTRFIINDNMSFFFELKYIYNNCDVTDFQFNNFGNAFEEYENITFTRFLLNIGMSWTL